MNDLVQQRRNEYNAEHSDDETEVALSLLFSLSNSLQQLFGTDLANECMTHIFVAHDMDEDEASAPAYAVLTDLLPEQIRKYKIYGDLVALNAYAYYGLPVEDRRDLWGPSKKFGHVLDTTVKRAACIEDLIETFSSSALYDFLSTNLLEDYFETPLNAAKARWKIDQAKKGSKVKIEELAALAQISLKSIKNLLTPSSGSWLKLQPDGTVSVLNAKHWLSSRSGFKPSVWQIEGAERHFKNLLDKDSNPVEDVIYVPVSGDGSWFSPEHQRNGKYVLGAKGREQPFDDYFEALEALNQMEVPMWRRPTEGGRWGIVSGVSWTRKTKAELGI